MPRPFTPQQEVLLRALSAANANVDLQPVLNEQSALGAFAREYAAWVQEALAPLENEAELRVAAMGTLNNYASTGEHEDDCVFSIVTTPDADEAATLPLDRRTNRFVVPTPGSLLIMNGAFRGRGYQQIGDFWSPSVVGEFSGGTHRRPEGVNRPILRLELDFYDHQRMARAVENTEFR